MLHSHIQHQNVTTVCLQAHNNFAKTGSKECSNIERTMLPYPLDSIVMHYAQFRELQADFPCEECLSAARRRWRLRYEQGKLAWSRQIAVIPERTNETAICSGIQTVEIAWSRQLPLFPEPTNQMAICSAVHTDEMDLGW